MVEEDVLAKTGPELFRELLRVYPVAEVEDYYRAGQWRDDIMKIDLQLVTAHRREGGAPDPLDLEDVKMPELPKPQFLAGLPQIGGVRPLAAVAGARPAMLGAVATAGAAGPAVELRLIALFVAKWKVDPTKTKLMLAKLSPPRRRFVIQNFKAAAGADPTAQLEAYITECETTDAWAGATAPGASPAFGGARPPTPKMGGVRPLATSMVSVGGVKRPASAITPASVLSDAAKRPRLGSAMVQRPTMPAGPTSAYNRAAVTAPRPTFPRPTGAAGPRAMMPSGVRPAAARPMMPKAKGAAAPGDLIRNLLQRF